MTTRRLDKGSLDTLFHRAHTHRSWRARSVTPDLLRELYSLMVMGPTSANCLPTRIAFVSSPEAKARLLPLVDEGNREQTRLAPVTAIVAYDLEFYEKMPVLYPHQPDARSWFNGSPEIARLAAIRNSSLQGGYFILAARALGLDCGPMGGFDAAGVAAEFFPAKAYEANFLCNIGYGNEDKLHPRLPRLSFEESCVLL